MKINKRNLLVVGVDTTTFDKVSPLFEPAEWEVDRFPRGTAALELLTLVPFSALIVRYPLPDTSLQEFLDALRSEASKCRQTPLVVLTEDELIDEARFYIGKGANRALSINQTAERLQKEVASLLRVAPRLAMRFMANLQVQLADGPSMAMVQTENLSTTGMLVRSTEFFPLGSQVNFEFSLPGDNQPVRGEARVVRHTTGGRESVRGVGMVFVEFQADGEARFHDYLEGQVHTGAAEGLS